MKRTASAFLLITAVLVGALFWQARVPAPSSGSAVDILTFFDGRSVSAGTVRTALIFRKDFTATFQGAREGETFRLEERFNFPEGERLQIWRLSAKPDGQIGGTVETEQADGTLADPVPVDGQADPEGTVLRYRGIAPGGGRTLTFTHTMRALSDGTVSNHVAIALFGIPIANSTVRFAKDAAALSTTAPTR